MKTTPTQERVGRVSQRRQVVIPREILETLKLQAGDLVAFAEQKNGVLIKPKRAVDAGDTLTPEEAKIVRRGEAQLKRGQSKPWRTIKNGAVYGPMYSAQCTMRDGVHSRCAWWDRGRCSAMVTVCP